MLILRNKKMYRVFLGFIMIRKHVNMPDHNRTGL